jgi:thioredoxin 2
LPWITEANDDSFEQVVQGSTLPVLLDLWADWCQPCKIVAPALEHVAHEMAGRLKLVKVDVDRSPAVAGRLEVQGIPTLVLVGHGRVISRRTGAAPEAEIRRWLDDALAGAPT